MIPALEKKAQWQHRLQQYHGERTTWRKIIDIIEDNEGRESLSLISPLTSLGKSYLFVSPVEFEYQPQGFCEFRRGLPAARSRDRGKTPGGRLAANRKRNVVAGDYYICPGGPIGGKNLPGDLGIPDRGWRAGTTQCAPRSPRKGQILQRVFPPKYYNSVRGEETPQSPPDSFEKGTMNFAFTVSAIGRVVNVQLIEPSQKSSGNSPKWLPAAFAD